MPAAIAGQVEPGAAPNTDVASHVVSGAHASHPTITNAKAATRSGTNTTATIRGLRNTGAARASAAATLRARCGPGRKPDASGTDGQILVVKACSAHAQAEVRVVRDRPARGSPRTPSSTGALVAPRQVRLGRQPRRHLLHQAGRLERADQRRGPRARQVEGGRERGAVLQPRLGGHHVGVAARTPVGDRVDGRGADGRAGPRRRPASCGGRSPLSAVRRTLGRADLRHRLRHVGLRRPRLAGGHHAAPGRLPPQRPARASVPRSGLGERVGRGRAACRPRRSPGSRSRRASPSRTAGARPSTYAGSLQRCFSRCSWCDVGPRRRCSARACRGAAAARGRPACSRRRTPSAPRGPAPAPRPGR